MGTRGPAPKPAKLRVLEGKAAETALADEFQPEGDLPGPPDEFDDMQAEIWSRVKVAMGQMLTLADYDTLRNYSTMQAELIAIEGKLERSGSLVTMNGKTQTNPLFRMRNQLVRNIHLLGSSLGLSPAARARIGQAGDEKPQQDPEYLKLIGAA